MLQQRKAVGNDRWKIKTKVISREWNKEGIFHLMMVFLIMIPVFLFLYYVYYSDNQPQKISYACIISSDVLCYAGLE